MVMHPHEQSLRVFGADKEVWAELEGGSADMVCMYYGIYTPPTLTYTQ